MTSVLMYDAVEFSANNGVTVRPSLLRRSEAEVKQILTLAFYYVNHPLLIDACQGGRGPLAGLGQISFEDFLLRINQKR